MSRLFPGDRLVWRVAGAVLGVILVVGLVALLVPRDHYTGTNSVGVRSVVADVPAGKRLCVPGLDVPDGTGRVRVAAFWQGESRPRFTARLDAGAVVRSGAVPPRREESATSATRVDIPISRLDLPARSVPGELCVTPGAPAQFGGMQDLQADQRSPTVDGKELGSRVAVWFLPPQGEGRSVLSLLPDALRRAALFRPAPIGVWTYVLLLFVVGPLLWFTSARLLATRAAGYEGGWRTAAAIAGIAFVAAGSWALITPPFGAPDEPEHYAYAETFAERGTAPEKVPGSRPAYSSRSTEALNAMRIYSHVERPDARPPWLEVEERRWRERSERAASPAGNGGGYLVSSSTHAPPYYGLAAGAYLATPSDSVFAKLTAMRLLSALMAAVVAACAFLTVRELFPRMEWLAVAAGLLVAFHPMFGFIGGALNNDNGVNAAGALTIYLVIRGLRRGVSIPLGLAIGATLVALPLMKGTGYALYPAAALGIAGMVWRRHGRRAVPGYAAIAGAAVAAQVLWTSVADSFGRSTFTTPGGVSPTASGGVAGGVLSQPADYLSYLWQVFLPRLPFMNDVHPQRWPAYDIYIERGWAAFGWYAHKFPMFVYLVIVAAVLGAGLLCAASVLRERLAARERGWELVVLLLALVGVVGGVAAAYVSVTPRPVVAEQGRYVFTAMVPLATIGVGACFAFGRRWAVPIASGLVGAMIGLSYASQWLALTRFFT